jgi:amino acid permease
VTSFSRWHKELILPAGLLTSLIVGAGIFALPFVFKEAGILIGLFYLVVFTAVFVSVHRMYAEVIANTPGRHRFLGYAEIYLGKKGFIAGIFTTEIGYLLVLTAYLALVTSFMKLAFPFLPASLPVLIFWLAGSVAILLSLGRLASFEFVVTAAIGLIVLYLFYAGITLGSGSISPFVNFSRSFLPYGVVLFALAGRAGISTLYDYFKKNNLSPNWMRRSINLGTVAPAIIYILFVLSVIRLSGGTVTPDALSGLTELSPVVLFLAGLLGIFTLWTSYFFLGLEVRDILRYDLKFSHRLALLTVVFAPLLLYMAGLSNFIMLIGAIGGVFLAIESTMVVLMYSRLKKWNIVRACIVIVFLVGALYEIYQLV